MYIMFSKIKTKIQKYFSSNKKNIFFVFWVLMLFLLSAENTFAETSESVTKFASLLDWLLKILASILSIMTVIASLFLDPAWISWSLFWLDTIFKDLWILVSNIVYFVFALILIWIAFMNIVWKWQDKYQLKTALPKFVIWILIVPFTWFFVHFVLSISAILTMGALTLPSNTFSEYQTKIDDVEIPKICDLYLGSASSTGYFHCNRDSSNMVKLWDLLKWEDWNESIFWVIAWYTYWVISIDKLDTISIETMADGVKKISDLIVKLWFDLLFILVYSILMITLSIALATRWIYLWIYTIISPVFWLMYFFWKKEWWGEWFIKNFSITEFVALALVPVYTMLALSFWLLFMFVIWNSLSLDKNSGSNTDNVSELKLDKKWVQYWEMRLNIKGWVLSSSEKDSPFKVTSFFMDTWAASLWVVWMLILQMFSIAVLWMAIMAALKTSSITNAVTQPIRDFWSQVWWLISKMPSYAPIFPWGQSMSSMAQIARTWANYYSAKQSNKANEFMEGVWVFWKGNVLKVTSESENMRRVFNSDKDRLTAEWYNALRKTIDSAEEFRDLYSNANFVNALKEALSTAKISSHSNHFDDLDVNKIKVGEQQYITDVLNAFDKVWEKDRSLGDLLTNFNSKSWGRMKVDDIQAYYKQKANNSTPNNPQTNNSTGQQNQASNAERLSQIREKTSNITINSSNNEIKFDNRNVVLDWYNEVTHEIIDAKELSKQLIKEGMWVDWLTEGDFDTLMDKLQITDGEEIRKLKKALGLDDK